MSGREVVAQSLGPQRFNATLLGALAALALVLAAIGLYGTVAHIVSQQTREIGVRMALGATRSSVVGLVLRQALSLVAAGVAVGTVGALGATRALQTLLTDISTSDPRVFVLAPALMFVVAVAAALRPALRAAGVRIRCVRCARSDTRRARSARRPLVAKGRDPPHERSECPLARQRQARFVKAAARTPKLPLRYSRIWCFQYGQSWPPSGPQSSRWWGMPLKLQRARQVVGVRRVLPRPGAGGDVHVARWRSGRSATDRSCRRCSRWGC